MTHAVAAKDLEGLSHRRSWRTFELARTISPAVPALFLGVLLWWLHPLGIATYPLAGTPKEVVSLTSAASVITTGTPHLELWPGERPNLPIEAMGPSDAALFQDSIVPTDFAGAYLLNVASVGGGPTLLRAIGVLEVVILASLAGALAATISGRKAAGVLAALMVSVSPALVSAGTGVAMHDALSAAFLIAGILFAIRSRSHSALIVAGILFGLSVGLRYPNVLLLPIAAYFVLRYRVGPVGRRAALMAGGMCALTVAAIVIPVHLWLYGGPLTIGSLIRLDLVESIGQGAEAQTNMLARAWRYISIYAVSSGWAIVGLLGIAGLVDRHRGLRVVRVRSVSVIAIVGTAVYLFVSLGPATYGIDVFRVNASILRYLLPLQILMSVAAAIWLRTRAMLPLTVATVVFTIGMLAISLFWAGGVQTQRINRELGHQAVSRISQEWEPSGITLISRVDTLFWPKFHTLNPAHLGAGFPREFGNSEFAHFYDGVAAPEVLALRMTYIADSGRTVALVEDRIWPDAGYRARLSGELRALGYSAEGPVELGPGFRAYEVRRLAVAADISQRP